MVKFSFSSDLSAQPDVVWRHAISPAGVNREFMPLLRMTFPANTTNLVASWTPGQRLFRSWLLLGGLLPVEYDDVVFVEVEEGRRFLERSSMLTQRIWQHERVIEPIDRGCRVTDRVGFVPRASWLAPGYARVFKATFWWRHWNLRRTFGDSSRKSRP